MKLAAFTALSVSIALCCPAVGQAAASRPTATGAINDSSALALYLAGNAALGTANYDQAADFFARASDLSVGEARDSLREEAFEAFVQAGDITRAAQIAPQGASGTQIIQQLGQLVVAVDALAGGDGAKAATILSGTGVGPTFRPTALQLLPWAQMASGQKNAPAPTVPGRSDPVTKLFANYNRALFLEFSGHVDQVDDAYKTLANSGPDFLGYELSYGEFLERQNRIADAQKVYDNILMETPDDERALQAKDRVSSRHPQPPPPLTAKAGAAQALISAGTIAMAENDQDTAITDLWLALRLDDKRTDALFLAASIESSVGSDDSARNHFAQIPPTAPEYVDARVSIAESWLNDHDNTRALSTARETVSKKPQDLNAKQSLAGVLAQVGKSSEAVNLFTQVIRARGDDVSWALYYARATAYKDMDDWKDAEKDLNKALELSPDQPEVLNYLGFVWADRGEHLPEALTMLQKAVAAKPNEGAFIDSLGWVYYRMGDIPHAIENLEKAVELDAADPDVNDHLGDAYLSGGRNLEALYQWERVLTLHPSDKLKTTVQAKIRTHQAAGATVASANSPAPVTP